MALSMSDAQEITMVKDKQTEYENRVKTSGLALWINNLHRPFPHFARIL